MGNRVGHRRARWLLHALAVLLAASSIVWVRTAPAQTSKKVSIGVVLDVDSERSRVIAALIQHEIQQLLASEFEVSFDPRYRVAADQTAAQVNSALDRLLQEPEVDLVLALGVLASANAHARQDLSKPVIAPFVIDVELPDPAKPEGPTSRHPANELAAPTTHELLSYVRWAVSLKRDLTALKQLGDFERVAFIGNQAVLTQLPRLGARLTQAAQAVGVELTLVPAGADATTVLSAIPKEADAVYVGPNMHWKTQDISMLAEGLNARGLPSFSWFGRQEVELGILAGLGVKEDQLRLARRVALNVQSILLGDKPNTLVTTFEQSEQLALNLKTARTIGVWPNWSVFNDAVLIGQGATKRAKPISMRQAVNQATKTNLDLLAERQSLSAGNADIKAARANLLPRLTVSAGAYMIDEDRAGFGRAERTASWGATLTQSLYSDRAWSNFDIQQDLQRSREHELEQLRLDVALYTASAYLNLLKAQTLEKVQRENLKLTRRNLALARMRKRLGSAGPEEVRRWEAQIASSRRDVIFAVALRNQSEIELNRLLNRPLEAAIVVKDAQLDESYLLTDNQEFRKFFDNPFRFRVFREFAVQHSMANSPELKAIDAALAARKTQLGAARRRVFVPDVGLQAGVTHRFWTDGAGTEDIVLPPGVGIELPNPNSFDWQVGVTATLPLYEGGVRYADIDRTRANMSELSLRRTALAQRLEQRVRSTLHRAGASFPAIELTEQAAAAAAGNLEIVADAYSQGAASIVQLLDAQNSALVSKLQQANATYDFLIDLVQLERAMGRLDFFQTKESQDQFFKHLSRFAAQKQRQTGATVAPAQ